MSVEGQLVYLLITLAVSIVFYMFGKKDGVATGVEALLVYLEDRKIITINEKGEIKGTKEDANV